MREWPAKRADETTNDTHVLEVCVRFIYLSVNKCDDIYLYTAIDSVGAEVEFYYWTVNRADLPPIEA